MHNILETFHFFMLYLFFSFDLFKVILNRVSDIVFFFQNIK